MKFLKGILATSAVVFTVGFSFASVVQAEEVNLEQGGSYHNWGTGQNGYAYCYEYADNGRVLNGGQAQPNFYCEVRRPSHHSWGRGQNGYGYCYQYSPKNVAMNEGRAQSNFECERFEPSYYAWGAGSDGYTHCYQYTPNRLPMNEGQAQPNNYCR